jgi:hypothetical protein
MNFTPVIAARLHRSQITPTGGERAMARDARLCIDKIRAEQMLVHNGTVRI